MYCLIRRYIIKNWRGGCNCILTCTLSLLCKRNLKIVKKCKISKASRSDYQTYCLLVSDDYVDTLPNHINNILCPIFGRNKKSHFPKSGLENLALNIVLPT